METIELKARDTDNCLCRIQQGLVQALRLKEIDEE
jgi:hypothetical protein